MPGLDRPVAEAAPATGADVRSLVSRRHVVMGALFAGISGAGLALTPQPTLRPMRTGTLEGWMPDTIGPWTFASASGVVLPPADALSDRLYDNLVTRTYTAPGQTPVMLLLAYSATQDGMLQVHRPEFCYRAGGYALSDTRDVDISDAKGRQYGANSFVATGVSGTEQVLYWIRIEKDFPQSWLGQRAAIMRANLGGRIPDGLLARVSSMSEDRAGSLASLRSFIVEFDRAAPPPLHAVLFGRPATTTA